MGLLDMLSEFILTFDTADGLDMNKVQRHGNGKWHKQFALPSRQARNQADF